MDGNSLNSHLAQVLLTCAGNTFCGFGKIIVSLQRFLVKTFCVEK